MTFITFSTLCMSRSVLSSTEKPRSLVISILVSIVRAVSRSQQYRATPRTGALHSHTRPEKLCACDPRMIRGHRLLLSGNIFEWHQFASVAANRDHVVVVTLGEGVSRRRSEQRGDQPVPGRGASATLYV